jgi:transmembrane sensor
VTKDKQHPFIVVSGKQEVKVLGTHFNICAYTDERVSKTTLLEGSVQITGPHGVPRIIKPGEQASMITTENDIRISNVDANDNLGVVMANLARWYNVRFIDEDDSLKQETVYAKLSRYQSLDKILQLLEKTDKVKFNIQGNVIRINRK